VHQHPLSRLTDRTHPSTGVEVRVLGGFAVIVDGVPTPARSWARRSAAALVKILALAPGHHLHREQVLDLLWPDDDPARSLPRLHKAAHFARRAAGRDDAVVLRDDLVWLFPDATIVVDAVEFERLARSAVQDDDPAAAAQALAWYRGELLPGDRYEEWAVDRRELLALRRLDVLRVAGQWRELVELDPTDEDAHLQLMQHHVAGGHAAAAIREYEHLTRVLERELGVEPRDDVRRAWEEASRAAARDAGPRLAPAGPDDLLAELAALVGRQAALLAALARRLPEGCPPASVA